MNANEYINGVSVSNQEAIMNASNNEFNSLTVLNAQCRVMDMLLDAVNVSHKDLPSTGKAAEDADRLIREQGLILAMTDDEEYVRNEVAGFVGRL